MMLGKHTDISRSYMTSTSEPIPCALHPVPCEFAQNCRTSFITHCYQYNKKLKPAKYTFREALFHIRSVSA